MGCSFVVDIMTPRATFPENPIPSLSQQCSKNQSQLTSQPKLCHKAWPQCQEKSHFVTGPSFFGDILFVTLGLWESGQRWQDRTALHNYTSPGDRHTNRLQCNCQWLLISLQISPQWWQDRLSGLEGWGNDAFLSTLMCQMPSKYSQDCHTTLLIGRSIFSVTLS